eukprot:11211202-Lingulodinium_polyedra.AAC.1
MDRLQGVSGAGAVHPAGQTGGRRHARLRGGRSSPRVLKGCPALSGCYPGAQPGAALGQDMVAFAPWA